ncbi:MAG: conjugal transfer protein TraX [Oscillospiraceae bacterium]|nr:conjugal transfer protein TraX [Oscillospiraceae bacterium]
MLKLNAYQLKWVAIIGMLLSHMVATWWGILPEVLRFPFWLAGGFTFPIMGFFVAEGYRHTSNLKNYILRVFLVGLIAMPFHILALTIPIGGGNLTGYPFLNIMFSIVLGLLVLVVYDKMKSRVLFWLLYIVVIVPISFAFFEWYFVGVTMILMYHIIRNETARRVVPSLFAAVCFLLLALLSRDSTASLHAAMEAGFDVGSWAGALVGKPEFSDIMLIFPVGIILAGLLLKGYTGERGKPMKWLFYAFYPLHFVLLVTVGWVFGLVDPSVLWSWF